MIQHLRRRSQRSFRIPEGRAWYGVLADFGLLNPTTVYVNSLNRVHRDRLRGMRSRE